MQKVYCFNDSGDDYIEKDLVAILIDKGFSIHYTRDEHRTKIVAVKNDFMPGPPATRRR